MTASSPRTDLCNIVEGSTVGVFDPISGNYSFKSTDNAGFPPGSYTFEITGTSGLETKMRNWVLTLKTPCSTPGVFTLKTNPFKNETYILQYPEIVKQWVIGDLVNVNTPADCGPFTVTFFLNDG